MKIALLQMTSGIDPGANGDMLVEAIGQAADAGAAMLFTPEMSGLLDRDGDRAERHVVTEAANGVLLRVRETAAQRGLWVQLGSLAVRSEDGARWANRSFVIDRNGIIVARYDKLHLFDVDLPTGESWRESSRYRAGSATGVVATPVGTLGLSICYDLRFPSLYQALTAAGASIISVPAAFTVPTGSAHWHVLLRARAIENASYVVAAAQNGIHSDGRTTFGHSLVVDPWGEVLLDMADGIGLGFCDLDLGMIDAARTRIPVIDHRRAVLPPQ